MHPVIPLDPPLLMPFRSYCRFRFNGRHLVFPVEGDVGFFSKMELKSPYLKMEGGGGKHRIRVSSCLPPPIDAGLDLEVLSLAHSFLLRYVTFLTLTLTNRLLVVKIALGLLAPKRQSMKLAQVREFGPTTDVNAGH